MKKVLFVATVTKHINTFHIPYLKLFKEKGYEVHVASNGDEKIEYCDKHYNLPFERFPIKINNIKTYNILKKIINENNYDIIHCHTPVGGVLTRLAARKSRKKGTRVIYTAHGFHFYKGAPVINWILYYPIEKYLSKFTDTLITINKEDFDCAQKKFSKKCKDIQFVPGVGINTEKFNIKMSVKEKERILKQIGVRSNDYILTCIARLDKNKNQGFLINAIELINKEHGNYHLLLVGPDELDGYYQKIVKDKKINDFVHFLGMRENIPQILYISDIVVSASKREGLPVSIIESFASGKPVIALKCRGMEDLITNNENGFIINNNDAIDFIKKIEILKNNSKKYNNICKNNKIKVKQFELSKIKECLERIYNYQKVQGGTDD